MNALPMQTPTRPHTTETTVVGMPPSSAHAASSVTNTTITCSKQPPPAIKDTSVGGGLTTLLLSGAFLAAILGAVVNTLLARRNTRIEERARIRATLAEAFQAYANYKEFPYAIRRRRADQPGEERLRLSEALRHVQSQLSYYQAWTLAESAHAGAAYNDLVLQGRKAAGAAMRYAWNAPALDNDEGMNIGSNLVDLTALEPAERRFIRAANAHVAALTKSWPQRVRDRFLT